MTISSVVDTTRGELLTTPAITRFTTLASTINTIDRGALFFAFEPSDIALAITQGAYGIITDTLIPIIDTEIAWIKVDDLSMALIKLTRFLLVGTSSISYQVDPLSWFILKTFKTSNLYFLDDIKDFAHHLSHGLSTKLIVCKDSLLARRLSLDVQSLPAPLSSLTPPLLKESFFETTYVQHGLKITQEIPAVYRDHFWMLYTAWKPLLDMTELPTKITLPFLTPFWVTTNFEKKSQGQTDHLVIAIDPHHDIDYHPLYHAILTHYRWAKICFFTADPQFLANFSYNNISCVDYCSQIHEILRTTSWHIAVCIGFPMDELFVIPQEQPLLF